MQQLKMNGHPAIAVLIRNQPFKPCLTPNSGLTKIGAKIKDINKRREKKNLTAFRAMSFIFSPLIEAFAKAISLLSIAYEKDEITEMTKYK